MIGFPNGTVYRLRGVGLILDHLARPPVADQREQTLEVTGRAQEGWQRIPVENGQRWQATRI